MLTALSLRETLTISVVFIQHALDSRRFRQIDRGIEQFKDCAAAAFNARTARRHGHPILALCHTSRLQQASKVLGVPVEYFYEGSPQLEGPQTGFAEGAATDYVSDFMMTNEGIQLMKACMRIRDASVRRRVIDLIDALGDKTKP